jgi:integrase/recombinase XerD
MNDATLRGRVSIAAWTARYLEWMRVRRYSERTVDTNRRHLEAFDAWCDTRGIAEAEEVTKPILERYQRHLFHYRKKSGRPLSYSSQAGKLVALRGLFRWLARQNVLLSNPASELELPRPEKRLPKHVLTASEVERVLATADVTDPLGLRDRAIMETFYSTGMRRSELAGLSLFDVDAERGTVMIRRGKGDKDRVVPIGERALLWIDKYTSDVRPELVVGGGERTLFLTRLGEPMTADTLSYRLKRYIDASETGKTGACHLFRHSMATLMLEGGADVRYVQEMLGHSKLETTQIYTHVSIKKLQAVHAATHPSAKLRPNTGSVDGGDAPVEDGVSASTASAEALLLSLVAEAAEEEDAVT